MGTLEEFFGVEEESPSAKRAIALAEADHDLLRALVKLRKAANLTQQDVADRLGITQASVASFERYDNDPKLSSIRRYAHAIGALVGHVVEPDVGQLSNPASISSVGAWIPGVLSQARTLTSGPEYAKDLASHLDRRTEELETLEGKELELVLTAVERYWLEALSRQVPAGEGQEKSRRSHVRPVGRRTGKLTSSAERTLEALTKSPRKRSAWVDVSVTSGIEEVDLMQELARVFR